MSRMASAVELKPETAKSQHESDISGWNYRIDQRFFILLGISDEGDRHSDLVASSSLDSMANLIPKVIIV